MNSGRLGANVLIIVQTLYKAVRAWSRRTLEKASEKVMDVPLDDDEEELVDDESLPEDSPSASSTATS